WTANRPTTPGCAGWGARRSPPRWWGGGAAAARRTGAGGAAGSPPPAGGAAGRGAGVCERVSVAVISDLLGVPEADRPLLRPWSAQICGMYEVNPTEEAGRVASRAATEFSGYLRTLARERRARPADDLITALTQVVDGGDQLTEDELIGTVVLLLNAGHEATVNFTGIGWWQLFRHPGQLERLRREPGLLPGAIDELLRYDTPLQMFERWVLEDVETPGGGGPNGAELGLLFGA